MCVCVCVCACACVCVCVCEFVYIYLYIYIYLSASFNKYGSIYKSIIRSLFIYYLSNLSINTSIKLSTFLLLNVNLSIFCSLFFRYSTFPSSYQLPPSLSLFLSFYRYFLSVPFRLFLFFYSPPLNHPLIDHLYRLPLISNMHHHHHPVTRHFFIRVHLPYSISSKSQ